MTKKIIVDLNTDYYDEKSKENNKEYLEANRKLLEVVTLYKNNITEFYQNKSWDKYKKLTNEYELIFTSPNASYNISKYVPVSRSFFKLWEILHDFKQNVFQMFENEPMNCFFIAEGPGGFAEALLKYRRDYHSIVCDKDVLSGMTLKSNNNKNIPDWKFKHSNFKVFYGKDGTGNLYNLDNIKYVVEQLNRNTVDFITADGGFDFSSDFNNQEEMSLRLITCEIYMALLLQKKGGTFIIKVFDIFTQYSLKLISLLCDQYDQVTMIKPLTSRPANSEKYLICMGFKGCSQSYQLILEDLISSTWSETNAHHDYVTKMQDIKMDTSIIKNLVMFNTFYISRQVLYIQKTIDYIKKFVNHGENGSIKKIIDTHVQKVKKWCTNYDIPI